MSEQEQEQEEKAEVEKTEKPAVEPETGRPRSSEAIGGRRSPLEDSASEKAGVFRPSTVEGNEGRTGKKISQWGASARRRSYWKRRYY